MVKVSNEEIIMKELILKRLTAINAQAIADRAVVPINTKINIPAAVAPPPPPIISV